MGAVVWPGEPNLAPDAMHAAIKEHGGVENRPGVISKSELLGLRTLP